MPRRATKPKPNRPKDAVPDSNKSDTESSFNSQVSNAEVDCPRFSSPTPSDCARLAASLLKWSIDHPETLDGDEEVTSAEIEALVVGPSRESGVRGKEEVGERQKRSENSGRARRGARGKRRGKGRANTDGSIAVPEQATPCAPTAPSDSRQPEAGSARRGLSGRNVAEEAICQRNTVSSSSLGPNWAPKAILSRPSIPSAPSVPLLPSVPSRPDLFAILLRPPPATLRAPPGITITRATSPSSFDEFDIRTDLLFGEKASVPPPWVMQTRDSMTETEKLVEDFLEGTADISSVPDPFYHKPSEDEVKKAFCHACLRAVQLCERLAAEETVKEMKESFSACGDKWRRMGKEVLKGAEPGRYMLGHSFVLCLADVVSLKSWWSFAVSVCPEE